MGATHSKRQADSIKQDNVDDTSPPPYQKIPTTTTPGTKTNTGRIDASSVPQWAWSTA